ncbi:hypothetical protein E0Z10_g9711 [Xylaria hypoxylon]|uniref:DUF6594 domain-containing protein n=1 Tax=Xylaria hypoxylon TaxID=37992 RepID=A0A4Z0Y7W7_9PEZI|nr:hypothetical protein E0Z10_g9711 [Xylaria hypoxylon]
MPDRGVQVSERATSQDVVPHERFWPLASAMNRDEDLVIIRRFGDLNMINILTIQTELDKLREDFRKACEDDTELHKMTVFGYLAEDPARKAFDSESDAEREQKETLKRDISQKIRNTLKEYHAALLTESQLRSLEPPGKGDLAYLRAWISPEIEGGELEERDRNCWGEAHRDDFVSLKNPDWKQNKILTYINLAIHIIYYKTWGYKKVKSGQIDSNVIKFGGEKQRLGQRTLKRNSAFLSRLVMALFGGIALIVPTIIMTLYQQVKVCLIVTAVATVLFALILAFGATDATGKDVLAATAAYTAVLVVFLGSSVGGNNEGP